MRRPYLPFSDSVAILTVQTTAAGTTWATFPARACNSLDIVNNSGAAIEYRRNGAGNSIVIPDGSSRLLIGITNANQIQVKRLDNSVTQVTVTAEAIN